MAAVEILRALREQKISGTATGHNEAEPRKFNMFNMNVELLSTNIYTEGYRSGHNEAVLKTSRIYRCDFSKTLDFIEVFGCSSALCEKPFSHLSRNLLASFSQFLAIFLQYPKRFEPIFKGTKDYSGQFNNLRRHIEAVITRLS